MLPVMAMCGQRWGLHMTATIAIWVRKESRWGLSVLGVYGRAKAGAHRTPEAVRTGLALSLGRSSGLYCSGIAAMISTSLGW